MDTRQRNPRDLQSHARGLEAGEGIGLDKLLQRHAVLQADRDGDGEVVHQTAEGRTFLVHIDEDFTNRTAFVLSGPEVDLVTADDGLLVLMHLPLPKLPLNYRSKACK